ncbi:MAG: DUF2797 domain-containing protein [Alphaproteobacteria bacterium]|nr:DUF2797 domain-containing protein [Alphaproteobacteria bacterium]
MKNDIQFLGIKWANGTPKFMLANDDGLYFDNIPDILNISITKTKKCSGYYDLEKREYKSCPNKVDMTESDFAQCKQCRDANGFGLCLGCNGGICRADNKHGLAFCNQPHIVYLALFPNDKFKVGTATEYRSLTRMYEQGAICSVFFAKAPNGRIARQIEQAASELDISKNMNSSYKMKNLIFDSDLQNIQQQLMQKLNKVRYRLSEFSEYFIEPEYNVFSEIYNKIYNNLTEKQTADLFGESKITIKPYDVLTDVSEITGNLKSVMGELLLTEKNGTIKVINAKPLIGFVINMSN